MMPTHDEEFMRGALFVLIAVAVYILLFVPGVAQ